MAADRAPTRSFDVVVVGAGVLGAWSALALTRRGLRVAMVEQHSPGHVRSSSGGESRLLRCAHGDDAGYTAMARRSVDGWRALGEEAGRPLLVEAGVAWFAHREDGWEARSATTLAAAGIPVERLQGEDAAALFPDVRTDDLAFVLYEPVAGVLHARAAVQACVEVAVRGGATLLRGRATPLGGGATAERGAVTADAARTTAVTADPAHATADQATAAADLARATGGGGGVAVDGRRVDADQVVWACGPWLPSVLGSVLDPVAPRITKQDVVFFGAGPAWATPPTPGWIDYDAAAYGLGDLDGRGVKCAPDVEGPAFDPERGERTLSPENERRARRYLAHRFPALAGAPLIGSRTCQYTLTADTAFVVAPHPAARGAWIVGGGSGHAFKHGPVVGAHVADLLTGRADPDPRFALTARRRATGLRTAGGGPTGGGPTGGGATGAPPEG